MNQHEEPVEDGCDGQAHEPGVAVDLIEDRAETGIGCSSGACRRIDEAREVGQHAEDQGGDGRPVGAVPLYGLVRRPRFG